MFWSYNFNQSENDPQNYYFFNEGFNKEELKTIDEGIKKLELKKATTVGEGDDSIRSSKIRWIIF